ncbi:MAG TPA: fructokinase [Rhodospirillaceae bacterium]|nr:fructokinase [Rhodospirillaceae bacterium]
MSSFLGLDIGGTKIAAGAFTHDGEKLAQHVLPTPSTYEDFLAVCAKAVAEVSGEADSTAPVGVGLPCAIDQEKGSVISVNLPFLADHFFRDDLEKQLGRKVRLANDAHCMALAEALHGAGKGSPSVFGMTIGTGVGGGFVYQGKIVEGPNGLAAEVGHIPLPYHEKKDGPVVRCGCGAVGCIETFASMRGLERLYKFVTGKEANGPEIVTQVRNRDEGAIEVLDRYYDVVAKAMSVVIYAYDPEVIVVSGGGNDLPLFYEEISQRWGQYCVVKELKTRLVKATHGPMAGLLGAALLWRD